MARRKLIWHIGLAQQPRAVIEANLEAHSEVMADAGVRVVADAEDARLATHELLRTHHTAGLARDDVEGRWARICDRVWSHRGVSVLSTPDLSVADKDQIRFALDPLIGVEVHLVITLESFSQQLYGGWLAELRSGRTTGWDKYVGRVLDRADEGVREHRQAEQFWAGHELAEVLGRWGWTFHADRLHVVAQDGVVAHWREFAQLAGLSADELPCVVPPYADPAGVAVLRKVNRQLEAPIGDASIDLLMGVDQDRAALPVAPTGSLQPLVERWRATLDQVGYDVRGDLAMLVDDDAERALPGPRDQLGVAVDALVDALAENARLRTRVGELEHERDRLERKRRKWKDRAQAIPARGSLSA
jgi:hypothetical protein